MSWRNAVERREHRMIPPTGDDRDAALDRAFDALCDWEIAVDDAHQDVTAAIERLAHAEAARAAAQYALDALIAGEGA